MFDEKPVQIRTVLGSIDNFGFAEAAGRLQNNGSYLKEISKVSYTHPSKKVTNTDSTIEELRIQWYQISDFKFAQAVNFIPTGVVYKNEELIILLLNYTEMVKKAIEEQTNFPMNFVQIKNPFSQIEMSFSSAAEYLSTSNPTIMKVRYDLKYLNHTEEHTKYLANCNKEINIEWIRNPKNNTFCQYINLVPSGVVSDTQQFVDLLLSYAKM